MAAAAAAADVANVRATCKCISCLFRWRKRRGKKKVVEWSEFYGVENEEDQANSDRRRADDTDDGEWHRESHVARDDPHRYQKESAIHIS